MRGDGLPDNKAVIDRLVLARDNHAKLMPGKPAIEVPVDALHFYESDGLKCVIDMEQVVYLADDMLRREPG